MTAHHATSPPKRIAIVGGGISGMACSWKLRDHDCDVDIYEFENRLGGHANSVPFSGNGRSVDVDTGFVVMDEATYPQFNNFLREIDVETIPTDMSFGVSTAGGMFEWGSYSILSFVGKLSNLFSPWYWRLLFDFARFSLFAPDVCHTEPVPRVNASSVKLTDEHPLAETESIGEYLKREGYSTQFMTYFLLPMVAAPWCIHPDVFERRFPAKHLIQFMLNHGLLDVGTKTLRWRSFRNGSKTYVGAFQQRLPQRHHLHLSTPVEKVTRQVGGGVALHFKDHPTRIYDHVVLAVHANQALTLLGDNATALERRMLSSFETTENVCYLHSSTSYLSKRPSARTAWTCLFESDHGAEDSTREKTSSAACLGPRISITFDMNKLQAIPFPGEPGSPGRVLVTMNPTKAPKTSQSSQVYYHPTFSARSIHMARHLDTINGAQNVSFAGAWMGFGFHEDGFAAGAHAAHMIAHGREKTPQLDLIYGNTCYQDRNAGFARTCLKIAILVVHHILVFISFFTQLG
ncbi:FAD/NAD(P)-binding domain-containing protein [Camillea tinctor]|nr:FAD/NAD(P)-binding domain-containing protein [Camillea tinctor]